MKYFRFSSCSLWISFQCHCSLSFPIGIHGPETCGYPIQTNPRIHVYIYYPFIFSLPTPFLTQTATYCNAFCTFHCYIKVILLHLQFCKKFSLTIRILIFRNINMCRKVYSLAVEIFTFPLLTKCSFFACPFFRLFAAINNAKMISWYVSMRIYVRASPKYILKIDGYTVFTTSTLLNIGKLLSSIAVGGYA